MKYLLILIVLSFASAARADKALMTHSIYRPPATCQQRVIYYPVRVRQPRARTYYPNPYVNPYRHVRAVAPTRAVAPVPVTVFNPYFKGTPSITAQPTPLTILNPYCEQK